MLKVISKPKKTFKMGFKWLLLSNRDKVSVTEIHTYIIGHYNPSVRIIDPVSHTTYVVYVNIYISKGTYNVKLSPNDRFFWETLSLQDLCNYSQRLLPEICWEDIAEGIPFFHISFSRLAWDTNPGFTSNKPTRLWRFRLFLLLLFICNLQAFSDNKEIW